MINKIYIHLLCRLQWVRSLFCRDKACGGDHLPPPSAKAKYVSSYTSNRPPPISDFLAYLWDSLLFYGHPAEY
jgi:hypothetical protein